MGLSQFRYRRFLCFSCFNFGDLSHLLRGPTKQPKAFVEYCVLLRFWWHHSLGSCFRVQKISTWWIHVLVRSPINFTIIVMRISSYLLWSIELIRLLNWRIKTSHKSWSLYVIRSIVYRRAGCFLIRRWRQAMNSSIIMSQSQAHWHWRRLLSQFTARFLSSYSGNLRHGKNVRCVRKIPRTLASRSRKDY